MKTITIREEAIKLLNEPCFGLFKHAGLYCCVQRVMWSGHLCGYVAVPTSHPLYGKDYTDKIYIENADSLPFNGNYIGALMASLIPIEKNMMAIDMIFNVHRGITYSDKGIGGIEEHLLGELWWFGFDTIHSGDLKPFAKEIDRQSPIFGETYRSFDFVEKETKRLAEQLAEFNSK